MNLIGIASRMSTNGRLRANPYKPRSDPQNLARVFAVKGQKEKKKRAFDETTFSENKPKNEPAKLGRTAKLGPSFRSMGQKAKQEGAF